MAPSVEPLKPLSFLGAEEQSIEMWGDSVVLTASVTVCGGKDRWDGVSERGK